MSLVGLLIGLGLAALSACLLGWKWNLGVPRVAAAILALGAVVVGIQSLIIGPARWPLPGQIGIAWAGTMGAGLLCLAVMFYRDPPRASHAPPGALLSPADGVVAYVRETSKGTLPVATKKGRHYSLTELTRWPLHGQEAVVIGISMSLLDVHVNRVPLSGRIAFSGHFRGTFGSLRRTEKLFENERATTIIEGDGLSVAVVQIASRLVRRIALFITTGQSVTAGQKLGAIRMGSQVDVVVPRQKDLIVTVREGERLRAGESVIAIRVPGPAL